MYVSILSCFFFFFFNDTATTEIYTLSLHDALPISHVVPRVARGRAAHPGAVSLPLRLRRGGGAVAGMRSGEHTAEIPSLTFIVCRLLLLKKKKKRIRYTSC